MKLIKPVNIRLIFLCVLIMLFGSRADAHCKSVFRHVNQETLRLLRAYPDYIISVTKNSVIWFDGTRMPLYDGRRNKTAQEKLDHPALFDQIHHMVYEPGKPKNHEAFSPADDPGRIRYEAFFRKMYGNTPEEVTSKLVTIYWMPKIFGTFYPLKVTSVNRVNQKFIKISHELENLVFEHPEYLPFLKNPGGTYLWRKIANTDRPSNHSYGMTIDINSDSANYWQWDLKKAHLPLCEQTSLAYKNSIPWEIVTIFEKHGFIWGGKWYHYDTMHFEYRPELFL